MDTRIDRQRRHFDSIAERYETARAHPNHLCLRELIWTELFKGKALHLPDPVSVLEPMCGFADGRRILTENLKVSIEYHGFDFSTEVISRLRKKDPSIDVWEQDVTTFHTDTKFDFLIILGGLHHVPHAAGKVVANLVECLKPGGLFINLEPTHGNGLFERIRSWIYKRNSLFDEETERAFSVEELCGFFERAGLENVDIFYPGMLAYVMYYNPDSFPSLNIGGPRLVRAIWSLERRLVRGGIARRLSFATLSMWRRPV